MFLRHVSPVSPVAFYDGHLTMFLHLLSLVFAKIQFIIDECFCRRFSCVHRMEIKKVIRISFCIYRAGCPWISYVFSTAQSLVLKTVFSAFFPAICGRYFRLVLHDKCLLSEALSFLKRIVFRGRLFAAGSSRSSCEKVYFFYDFIASICVFPAFFRRLSSII